VIDDEVKEIDGRNAFARERGLCENGDGDEMCGIFFLFSSKIGLRRYPSNEQHDGEHSYYHCLLSCGHADSAWLLLCRCWTNEKDRV
jgi:hypothetical protein